MPTPELCIYTISLLNDGKYRLARSTKSGDVSRFLSLGRLDLQNYFTEKPEGTLANVWKDLDQDGIVEFSVLEG